MTSKRGVVEIVSTARSSGARRRGVNLPAPFVIRIATGASKRLCLEIVVASYVVDPLTMKWGLKSIRVFAWDMKCKLFVASTWGLFHVRPRLRLSMYALSSDGASHKLRRVNIRNQGGPSDLLLQIKNGEPEQVEPMVALRDALQLACGEVTNIAPSGLTI